MKLVNRYHLWASLECQHFSKAEAVLKFSAEEDGMWVQWQDYASLKEEVERLRASSFVTAVPVEEYEKLKVEVERLTKSYSDALADFWAIHKGYFDLKAEVEQLRKEGKQP